MLVGQSMIRVNLISPLLFLFVLFLSCLSKEPFSLTGDAAQGYQKRKISTINLQPGGQQGGNTFLAFRLSVNAAIDNATGEVPMMRDFFLEGFALHKAGGNLVRKEPKNCIIF